MAYFSKNAIIEQGLFDKKDDRILENSPGFEILKKRKPMFKKGFQLIEEEPKEAQRDRLRIQKILKSSPGAIVIHSVK
jgi:hypothetical protein